MDLSKILFIVLCVTLLPFGFASMNTTRLPSEEVDALREIGSKLGKVWSFDEDPCGWPKLKNDTYDDTVDCNCDSMTCHVVNIDLTRNFLDGTIPIEWGSMQRLLIIDEAARDASAPAIPRDTEEKAQGSQMSGVKVFEGASTASLTSFAATDFDYLTYRTVEDNMMSGIIPEELGSLARIERLFLNSNNFTGEFPASFANLTTLKELTVEDNMMSGIIPEELGSLARIERLFLNSNNFTGEFPASFANLTTLKEFRIGGNSLSGKIPEFIGKWNNLNSLRIQASGLEGPIPSNITLLPTLTDLRISDLNGPDTPCPPFINTTPFENLILRSCNLIGNLPESLSDGLKVLDLSFNKLNGSIPDSYNNIKKTDHIYLTGNMLSGSVPDWMLKEGDQIDLSYNRFTYESSRDLRCQRRETKGAVSCLGNMNCPIIHTSLYINCGGKGLSVEDKFYEEDDLDSGGPTRFFIVTDRKWGFSNTGHFLDDSKRDSYIVGSASPVNSSELYTSARTSALSLTYYGLCMHNGSYNVSLHFAEIMFTDGREYSSLGRRVFDIYIQGVLFEKDFDISDEAGGAGKVTVKTYTVNVLTTLEIRLYWAGKGTTNIPSRGVYGPLISAISVNPNFPIPRNDGSLRVGTVVGIVVGAFCAIVLILGLLWWRGCLRHKDANELAFSTSNWDEIASSALMISLFFTNFSGYMAPEYALRGYLTDKADVYSYGIVLLEIVSGMANVADRAKENHFVLLDRAVALNNTGNIMELVDSRLDSKYDMQEVMVVINLALLCTTISPTDRPAMSLVVSMLEGRIVPQSFVSEQSMSMSKMDREKMMKQLESTTESQIEEMSIPYTDSSMSAVDLYPVDRFSEYLQKRDGEAKKLLS
ncbi:leucine-rich repeat transmembrane protein kinase [Artemisia annua]|uniref:non-specific serine/threonine protein kinase n=1 Tax=Artemisia annua TaxID=35608 RepID=A0A2U1KRG5_ARTAN|nr:leucine-rich repeat transmembrane protein kinase [Artemisia annua]